MAGFVDPVGLDRMFDGFAQTARRLETRERYDVTEERKPFERFLAGQHDGGADIGVTEPWLERVRASVAAGKRFERVRVVPEPLTDYLRFELRACQFNVTAGEDIRYLHQAEASRLDLPSHDFWVFDSATLVLLYFANDDRLLGAQAITDPDTVAVHEAWILLAMSAATSYPDYIAADPSRDKPSQHRP